MWPAAAPAAPDVPAVPLARCSTSSTWWGTGSSTATRILHHPQNPAFEYPVIAALVDLDEGVRVMSNLVDVDPADVTIGMPVTVDFRPTRHDGAVPVFKPRATADG